MTLAPNTGGRTLACACGLPATVAIVVIEPKGNRRFGWCQTHIVEVVNRPDIVQSLVGHAEIVTSFTERRLRQLAELPP